MSLPEITGENDYHSLEIACVRLPEGRWRVFPTLITHRMQALPIQGGDYFDLPTFPDRYLAETFGCFLAWQFLDEIQVWDPGMKRNRPLDVLE